MHNYKVIDVKNVDYEKLSLIKSWYNYGSDFNE